MIRFHVVMPECGRKDFSYVDTSFSYDIYVVYVVYVVVQICREYIFIYFTKKYVTPILSVFRWIVSCGEV